MLFPKGLLKITYVIFISALSGNILHLLIRLTQQLLCVGKPNLLNVFRQLDAGLPPVKAA